MNKIEELIEKFCPEGVEYKTLGKLGNFENTGVDKKTIKGQKIIKLLNYVDIYKNRHIFSNTPNMLVSAKDSQIIKCDVCKGDIYITPSSETKDDIGHTAVIEEDIDCCCYSYHIMRYRLHEINMIMSYYINYVFDTSYVKKQIYKLSQGLTRFGLSKQQFSSISIPVPPLPIQEAIVKILDNFSSLTAELQAELQARKSQYEFYRNQLLTFEREDDNHLNTINTQDNSRVSTTICKPRKVKWMRLGDIGTLTRGGSFQKKDFIDKGVGCIHYGQIYTYFGTYTDKVIKFLNSDVAKKQPKASKGDLVITLTSENIEDVCKCVAWLGDDDIAISGHAAILCHNQNPKYLAYYLQTKMFFDQKKKYARGAKVIEMQSDKLATIEIPIPSLSEQQRIVSILDRFDTLINDISTGLPAEIAARQQQYEYYRDKLLTFKRKEA